MSVCPSCGAQLPDGSKFCGACGASMIPAAVQHSAFKQTPAAFAAPAGAGNTDSHGQGGTDPHGQFANWPRNDGKKQEPPKKSGRAPLWMALGALAMAAVVAVMAVLGVISFGRTVGGDRIEGSGYDSPEAAARAYVEALSRHDLDGMLSSFAVETLVEKLDPEKYVIHLRSWLEKVTQMEYPADTAYGAPLLPGLEHPLGGAITRAVVTQDLITQLYLQFEYHALRSLGLSDEAFQSEDSRYSLIGVPRAQIPAAEALLSDPAQFSSIELGRVYDASELLTTEAWEELTSFGFYDQPTYLEYLGAEAIRHICVELTVDGVPYRLYLLAVQYGGRWYNKTFDETVFGTLGEQTPALGFVRRQ